MLRFGLPCLAGVALALSLAPALPAAAQSDLDLTLEEYMAKAGPDAKVVPAGELRIDEHRMICGKRPTVIDPNFDSWGGAFPGFVILNTQRLDGLATPIKLYVYAHECAHQFIGRDEEAADCFAVKRGRRYGWLDEKGMDQICGFISKFKSTWDHLPGPKRCEQMRRCYKAAAPRSSSAGQ